MKMRNSDGATNTQSRDNKKEVVFYIGPAGHRTQNRRDSGTMTLNHGGRTYYFNDQDQFSNPIK